MRKIKCKNCKELFTPFRNNALQKFCLNNDECLKVAKTLALESKWKKEKAKIKNDLEYYGFNELRKLVGF